MVDDKRHVLKSEVFGVIFVGNSEMEGWPGVYRCHVSNNYVIKMHKIDRIIEENLHNGPII